MKINLGLVDRAIRFVVAAAIAVLYCTKVINGTLALVLGILAVVFIVTSFISFCPLYTFIGLSTKKKVNPPA